MVKKPQDTKEEAVEAKKEETVEVKKEVLDSLLAEVSALKERDAEYQEKLKMLYEVADKGRILTYESRKVEKKPLRVKLSKYQGGIIIGWRNVKDELITDPKTGATVGEDQRYEVKVLGNDGEIKEYPIRGYATFSEARYNERIEAEVANRREDWDGNVTFDLKLPDGRVISLDGRFVN